MNKLECYTVGKLRAVLEGVPDDAPVVAAPLNDKIRVALDVNVTKDAKLGEYYEGDIVVFSTGLFDIETNKEVNLVSSN